MPNDYKMVFTNPSGVRVEYNLDTEGYFKAVESLPRTNSGALQCVCYRCGKEARRFLTCTVPQEARALRTNGPVTLLSCQDGVTRDRRSTTNLYTLDMIKLQTVRCDPSVGFQLYVLYDQMVDSNGVLVEGTSEVIHCKTLPMLANYGPLIERRKSRRHPSVQR